MGYDDFLADLRKANLTVRGFAAVVGMNPNSISNYARQREVPRHLALIAALLGEMSLHGLPYQTIVERIQAPRRRPRGGGRTGRFGGDPQEQLELE